MDVSIILPCYNERENIERTVNDVISWMADAAPKGEIIVVDDGSKDGSAELLDDLAKNIGNLRVIHRQRNGGYGIAVRDGCDAATTEWIGFMDSDGQFRAADLNALFAHAGEAAFITGRRAKRADSLLRNAFGKVLGAMNFVMLGLWVRDVNCGMKIFTRDIWPDIRPTYGVEKLFNTEMFLRLKKKNIPWITVNVPHYPRTAGTPTGGSLRVIFRMFKELYDLRMAASDM